MSSNEICLPKFLPTFSITLQERASQELLQMREIGCFKF